jgi:hypothetical protein
MYNKIRLDIQTSRYGYLALPYLPQLKFDYNHIYSSIEDVIMDFELNGFIYNGFIDGFYEFERIDVPVFE